MKNQKKFLRQQRQLEGANRARGVTGKGGRRVEKEEEEGRGEGEGREEGGGERKA